MLVYPGVDTSFGGEYPGTETRYGDEVLQDGEFGEVIIITGMIIVEWLFLYYLYKKKIFLRV